MDEVWVVHIEHGGVAEICATLSIAEIIASNEYADERYIIVPTRVRYV